MLMEALSVKFYSLFRLDSIVALYVEKQKSSFVWDEKKNLADSYFFGY